MKNEAKARVLTMTSSFASIGGTLAAILGLYWADLEVHSAPPKRPAPVPETRRASWSEASEPKKEPTLEDVLEKPSSLPDLEKLKEQLTDQLGTSSPGKGGAPIVVRAIQVDIGPPRSDVFVSGRLVGKTPYVGQWSCREGDDLRVEVVPAKGAPLLAKLHCVGNRLVAR